MNEYIAVDWGSTQLRAWRIREGECIDKLQLPCGVTRLNGQRAEAVFQQQLAPWRGDPALPVVMAGIAALLLSRALNSLSLGNDTATALGSRVARTQLIGLIVITVLCGSATAVVGPIAFIGLMMPHMARWLVGADHRWSLPVTLLATPALLLFADVIGRLLVPGELRVSVVSAFLGAPVLIWLVRRQPRGGGL